MQKVTEEYRHQVQKHTLRVVILSQILGGAGLAAGITVGALLAQEMLGSDGLAGIPTALFTLGAALSAYLVGRSSNRWGRRLGLGYGFIAGALGAIGVVVAAALDNVPLLFFALFVYGAGSSTNLQTRYAGTDLADDTKRGTAISLALVATTFGAVAGPNLVGLTGNFAASVGLPALAGPFLLAAVAYLAAGVSLLSFLRPDPFLLARQIEEESEVEQLIEAGSQGLDLARQETQPKINSGVFVGATIMILTQISMVAIMTMTPVHMRGHGFDLNAVGLVIGLHIAAMFLPSLATGVLVDKVGRVPMAIAAGITLLLAGITAAIPAAHSLGILIVSLVLLGLGWNFGLIAGTALIVDSTDPASRPRVQGTVDVGIALAGAGGGAISGIVMATSGYATLSLAGGFLALLLVPVLLWTRKQSA